MIRFYDYGMGTFTPKQAIAPCRWNRFDLFCVHQGTIELRVEGHPPLIMKAGAGLLIYPHTRFEGSVAAGVCNVSVQHFMMDATHANTTDMPQVFSRLLGKRSGFEQLHFSQEGRFESHVSLAMELAFLPQSKAVLDQRIALLVLILAQLNAVHLPIQLQGTRQAWEDLEQWMRLRLNSNVTVQMMATQMGMSTAHFSHRFKQLFGITPGRYFQRLRIQESLRLLRETDLPIKQIAQQLNFDDLPNFYRLFRSQVNVSPANYRLRHTLRG